MRNRKARDARCNGNAGATTQPRPAVPGYSTKIIKAGALLADTRAFLEHWDANSSVQDNIGRFRTQNIFGKASRSRVQDILAVFKQRYLTSPGTIEALSVLARSPLSRTPLDRILYYHSAKSDRLLYDTVVEILLPSRAAGITDVSPVRVQNTLARWGAEGKASSPWAEPTTRRVMHGLLSTLRDFSVLEGAVNKRIAAMYLPVEAFAYIAFVLKQGQPSGQELIGHLDWRLFFLSPEGVERFLAEAHQRGLLEWHAAGSVTRLTFPADSMEGYARVLAQRAY